ncbi:hypothetical protein V7S43_005085 [Phytophthora oleae]|uniref:Protein kinase domain-containing protein n=1 Tax=Phytophthora oleae TaxID=2107226 RepID=A0ABD3FU04_9STRA
MALLSLLFLAFFFFEVNATKYDIMATYLDLNCSTASPYIVYARQNGGCTDGVCYAYLVNQRINVTDERASTDCAEEDYLQVMRSCYQDSPYIIHELYSDNDCSTFEYAVGFLATNSCLGGNQSAGLYYESSLNADGSATVTPYFVDVGSGTMEGDDSCLSASAGLYDFFTTDSANSVSSFRWYSSNDLNPSVNEVSSSENSQSSLEDSISASNNGSSSGSIATENRSSNRSSGAVTGIILAAVFVAVAILLAICFSHRRFKAMHEDNRFARATSPVFRDTDPLEAVSGQKGLWDDEIITAKRIPRDKIKTRKLISRGAFGEVYSGVFFQRRVAIKMLPASTRTSLQHVNAFLTEAKITATMEHPHIVSFVGVACDSLSDLCVALEFMDGGDLRQLLNK